MSSLRMDAAPLLLCQLNVISTFWSSFDAFRGFVEICNGCWGFHREEELAEGGGEGGMMRCGGTEDAQEDRRLWMANAETAMSSPGRAPLWADGQFHILEMQTGRPPTSPSQNRQDSSSPSFPASPSRIAKPLEWDLHTSCTILKYLLPSRSTYSRYIGSGYRGDHPLAGVLALL